MKKHFVIVEPTANGFSAYSPDLPGCVATGDPREDAEREIIEAEYRVPMALEKERTLRPGLDLLEEFVCAGPAVERHERYRLRLRMWLRRGDPVVWSGSGGGGLDEEGSTLVTELRVDRDAMFAGLFHTVLGMNVGGVRTVRVAPHLAYGESGVPGRIPPNAILRVEVALLGRGG